MSSTLVAVNSCFVDFMVLLARKNVWYLEFGSGGRQLWEKIRDVQTGEDFSPREFCFEGYHGHTISGGSGNHFSWAKAGSHCIVPIHSIIAVNVLQFPSPAQ
jgi:hypothetical protein